MIEEITSGYVIYLGIFCDLKRACQMTIHLLKTGLLNEGRLHFLATLQNFLAKRRSGRVELLEVGWANTRGDFELEPSRAMKVPS